MDKNDKLVLDVETVGFDFDTFDDIAQKQLTKYFERYAKDNEELEEAKDKLGFWPLTGFIVKGMSLINTEKKGENLRSDLLGQDITVFSGNEAQILEEFWKIASKYNTFITFNGRAFDAPFLAIRSMINKIRPSKNLLANRYLNSQPYDVIHIDLADQLTFYGAFRRNFSLHFWSNALNIKSPKADGVTGDDIKALYEANDLETIVRYNLEDVRATASLYKYWKDYIAQF